MITHGQAGALLPKSSQAFRTISEVAEELDIQKHVLRFWESKFNQLKPMKRGGGRRYYRPEDVELLRGIHHLLRSQAYTIKGVQRILREQGVDFVKACWQKGFAGAKIVAGDAAATMLKAQRGAAGGEEPRAPAGRKGAKAKLNSVAAADPKPLSARDAKALKGVVDQLEAARQSLARTRTDVQAASRKEVPVTPPRTKAKAAAKRR